MLAVKINVKEECYYSLKRAEKSKNRPIFKHFFRGWVLYYLHVTIRKSASVAIGTNIFQEA